MGGDSYVSTVPEGVAMDFLPVRGEPVQKVVVVIE